MILLRSWISGSRGQAAGRGHHVFVTQSKRLGIITGTFGTTGTPDVARLKVVPAEKNFWDKLGQHRAPVDGGVPVVPLVPAYF